jgi:hypothetical protein
MKSRVLALPLLLTLALFAPAANATWAFVSPVGTLCTDDGDPASCVPALPANWAPGDLLVLVRSSAIDGNVDNCPDGWTDLETEGDQLAVCGKIAAMGETAPTATNDGGANGAIAAQIAAYSGAPSTITGILHAGASGTTGAGSQDIATVGLTITEDNTLVIAAGMKHGTCLSGGSAVANGLSAFTERGDHQMDTAVSDYSFTWADLVQTTAANIAAASPGFNLVSTCTPASRSALVSLIPANDAEWTVSPSVVDRSMNGYTLGFTTDIDATFYSVACPIGSDAVTGAEVVAGECASAAGHGTCTKAVTGGVGDTCVLTVTDDPPFPAYNLHSIACPEAGIC